MVVPSNNALGKDELSIVFSPAPTSPEPCKYKSIGNSSFGFTSFGAITRYFIPDSSVIYLPPFWHSYSTFVPKKSPCTECSFLASSVFFVWINLLISSSSPFFVLITSSTADNSACLTFSIFSLPSVLAVLYAFIASSRAFLSSEPSSYVSNIAFSISPFSVSSCVNSSFKVSNSPSKVVFSPSNVSSSPWAVSNWPCNCSFFALAALICSSIFALYSAAPSSVEGFFWPSNEEIVESNALILDSRSDISLSLFVISISLLFIATCLSLISLSLFEILVRLVSFFSFNSLSIFLSLLTKSS